MLTNRSLCKILPLCATLAAVDNITVLYKCGYSRHTAASFFLNLITLILSIMLVLRHKRIIQLLQKKTVYQAGTIEQSLQAKLSVKQLQLRLLQNQINPHFLYNTLDCIRSQALTYKQPEIAEITERLSRYFRYCISRNEHIVSLRQEIKNVKDYFYIQRYRFGEKISMKTEIEDDALLDFMIPKTVLQPLVENAIVHGLEPIAENGTITLTIRGTEEQIYINISDTGVGIPLEKLLSINKRLKEPHNYTSPNESSSRTSIGLINVNERIRICFGEAYGLHFRSVLGAGTDVQLIIPKVDDVQWLLYDNRLKNTLDHSSDMREFT